MICSSQIFNLLWDCFFGLWKITADPLRIHTYVQTWLVWVEKCWRLQQEEQENRTIRTMWVTLLLYNVRVAECLILPYLYHTWSSGRNFRSFEVLRPDNRMWDGAYSVNYCCLSGLNIWHFFNSLRSKQMCLLSQYITPYQNRKHNLVYVKLHCKYDFVISWN